MSTKTCTHCFKSLGVAARMKIYSYLLEHPRSSVSEVVAISNLTQPTVSYHLKDMRDNGVLISEKKGKEVLYSIDTFCPHLNTECVLSKIRFPERS